MTIQQCASDWYSVMYRGTAVADFSTRIAAEAYVRRMGWAVCS